MVQYSTNVVMRTGKLCGSSDYNLFSTICIKKHNTFETCWPQRPPLMLKAWAHRLWITFTMLFELVPPSTFYQSGS